MDKKKIMYIGILLIVTVIVTITSFSYAFLTRIDEEHGKLNMVVGDLTYKIESSDLTNNSITLSAGEATEIELTIKAENEIDTKFELYTNSVENVNIGYVVETGFDESTGTISKNGTKKIKIVLENNGNTSQTIIFGVQGGFDYNTLTLASGRVSIEEGEALCHAGIAYEFSYTGSAQEFTARCPGVYKVETWGAEGYMGGSGAYTSGKLTLDSNDTLYVYVGEKGFRIKGGANTPYMSYNGGGISGSQCSRYEEYGGYSIGGGATDVRTVNGNWDNNDSLRSRIMVAAGGGATGGSSNNDGAGGGLTGYDGIHNSSTWGTGGSQTAGGTLTGAFGKGGTGINNQDVCNYDGTGGGGSGWYGGGGSESNGANTWSQGGGGSSYISGHTGCVAVTSKTDSTPKSGCTTGSTNKSCSLSPYEYEFTDTVMIDGTGCKWTNQKTSDCSGQLQPDGTTAAGHTGNGYARITYLGLPECQPGYTTNFDYTGNVQSFTAKCNGTYKLETWGAQGGSCDNDNATYAGGYGAYAVGTMTLTKNEVLNIAVGGSGNTFARNTTNNGPFNGGGGATFEDTNWYGGTGGSSTEISLNSTYSSSLDNYTYKNTENYYNSRIIVAAGGGGSVCGVENHNGGVGGGISSNTTSGYVNGSTVYASTQTTAGYNNYASLNANNLTVGGFGYGGRGFYGGGGGAGYYGGGGGYGSPGSGGSSYIGNTLLTNKKMVCYNCTTSTDTDTYTETNTCTNATATANCSKTGNGYARITYIGD